MKRVTERAKVLEKLFARVNCRHSDNFEELPLFCWRVKMISPMGLFEPVPFEQLLMDWACYETRAGNKNVTLRYGAIEKLRKRYDEVVADYENFTSEIRDLYAARTEWPINGFRKPIPAKIGFDGRSAGWLILCSVFNLSLTHREKSNRAARELKEMISDSAIPLADLRALLGLVTYFENETKPKAIANEFRYQLMSTVVLSEVA